VYGVWEGADERPWYIGLPFITQAYILTCRRGFCKDESQEQLAMLSSRVVIIKIGGRCEIKVGGKKD
jgi:hypothetical protein